MSTPKERRRQIKQLKEQLTNTTKGSLSITDYMHSIKTQADQLAVLGKPLDEDDLIDKVLDGLDPTYQSLIDAVDNRTDIITFDELLEKLIHHESSLQNASTSTSLLPRSALLSPSLRMNQRRRLLPEYVQRKNQLVTVPTGSIVLRNDGPYTLPQLLEEINNWMIATGFPKGAQILGSKSQRELVINYFSKFGGESSISSRMDTNVRSHRDWPRRLQPENYESICKLVQSFFEELGELFHVPKTHQISHTDNHLVRKQLITSFICFLLQLLSLDSNSSRFPFMEDLRFLVTIIGDTPFQAASDDQLVQSLLLQFEEGANRVGPLVHSLIFFRGDLKKTGNKNEAFKDLRKHIQFLYDNIGTSLNQLSNIVTPEAYSASDSLVILNALLSDLKDLMNREDDTCIEIKDEAKMYRKMLEPYRYLLRRISALSRYSVTEELTVLVTHIRDLAYEADYLINAYTVGDAPLWYVTTRCSHLVQTIESAGTKLQDKEDNYYSGAIPAQRGFDAEQISHPKQYPGVHDDIIVGFDDEEISILHQLKAPPSGLQCILISGMPGLGKTTLAKKVCNHSLIHHYFDIVMWCVVSQVYQVETLLSSIWNCIHFGVDKTEEHLLGYNIFKSLFERKYLIVLDDIWSSTAWDDIRVYFPDNRNGSRVLFTSRDKAAAPRGSFIHELSLWSEIRCWELLERKVFGVNSCPDELLEIGHEIAGKCYGLPLAVVVIAGLLSSMEPDRDTWENFKETLPDFPDLSESMMHLIKLSYNSLPEELKPCYLYLTVFQEDKEVSVKKLFHLWIAEGFILPKSNEEKESVAQGYLMQLIDRNLVTVSKRRVDGGVKSCVIHDLLRDTSMKISEEENFLTVADHDSLIWNQKFPCVRVHFNCSDFQTFYGGYEIPHGQSIRSIFGYLPDIPRILVKMKLLRVMCCRTKFKDLFGIELLVYLRYLILDDMVPSLECLQNLEFLIVNSDSVTITSNILNMAKLRYLRFHKALFARDCCISEPNILEFLSCVVIRDQRDVEVLKYLRNLRRLKCEYQPSWNKDDAVHPCLDLSFLTLLESLTITAELFDLPIDGIIFPYNIRKLSLSGFGLAWGYMSIIGQLGSLEVLKLGKDAFVGEQWYTVEGEFMQLKFLKLKGLNLSYWDADHDHFPRLRQLVIENCPNLESIPIRIGDIPTLQSIHINGEYTESLLDSAKKILEEQKEKGNDELKLQYTRNVIHEVTEGDSDGNGLS